ncbi:MAG: ATP cone domain-containing protein [archaeon]
MATKTKTTKSTLSKGRKFSSRKVVKRHGHTENFDERKIYATVYEAAHANQLPTARAEKLANTITKEIEKWIEKKERVNSHEIHKEIYTKLRKHDKEIAFLYETHRDIC